jgi:hypothetical protein
LLVAPPERRRIGGIGGIVDPREIERHFVRTARPFGQHLVLPDALKSARGAELALHAERRGSLASFRRALVAAEEQVEDLRIAIGHGALRLVGGVLRRPRCRLHLHPGSFGGVPETAATDEPEAPSTAEERARKRDLEDVVRGPHRCRTAELVDRSPVRAVRHPGAETVRGDEEIETWCHHPRAEWPARQPARAIVVEMKTEPDDGGIGGIQEVQADEEVHEGVVRGGADLDHVGRIRPVAGLPRGRLADRPRLGDQRLTLARVLERSRTVVVVGVVGPDVLAPIVPPAAGDPRRGAFPIGGSTVDREASSRTDVAAARGDVDAVDRTAARRQHDLLPGKEWIGAGLGARRACHGEHDEEESRDARVVHVVHAPGSPAGRCHPPPPPDSRSKKIGRASLVRAGLRGRQ